jgi:hypothetical protein
MTLRTAPSHRDVRTRSAAFRVDLGTRYVTICVASLVAGRSGGGIALYDEAHGVRIVGRVGRETVNRKRKLSAVSLQPIQNPSYMSHCIAAMHTIFTRIGCTLFTCDMYMCRIRHK